MATRKASAPILPRETRAAPVQLEANTAMVRVGIVAFDAHGEEYAAEKVEGCNGEVQNVSRTGKFCGVSSCFRLVFVLFWVFVVQNSSSSAGVSPVNETDSIIFLELHRNYLQSLERLRTSVIQRQLGIKTRPPMTTITPMRMTTAG